MGGWHHGNGQGCCSTRGTTWRVQERPAEPSRNVVAGMGRRAWWGFSHSLPGQREQPGLQGTRTSAAPGHQAEFPRREDSALPWASPPPGRLELGQALSITAPGAAIVSFGDLPKTQPRAEQQGLQAAGFVSGTRARPWC